jgi:hypothetical protein
VRFGGKEGGKGKKEEESSLGADDALRRGRHVFFGDSVRLPPEFAAVAEEEDVTCERAFGRALPWTDL